VRQPLRESGRLGARLLLAALDGDEMASPREPPPVLPALEVVVRRTVSQPLT
jgi:DNA-binding LacI/PurR family transcriptional regulator